MDLDWNSILQSSAVSSLVLGIVGFLFMRSKNRAEAKATDAAAGRTDAETEGVITQAARDVVIFYREEFAELRSRVEVAEGMAEAASREVAELRAHVAHLEDIIRAQGGEPPQRPTVWKAG